MQGDLHCFLIFRRLVVRETGGVSKREKEYNQERNELTTGSAKDILKKINLQKQIRKEK